MLIDDTCELPENAATVWLAYQAMATSKEEHFAMLRSLEQKYEKYGQPDAIEKAQLDQLLRIHDSRVSAFKKRLLALKASDPHAYGLLVSKLSQAANTNTNTMPHE